MTSGPHRRPPADADVPAEDDGLQVLLRSTFDALVAATGSARRRGNLENLRQALEHLRAHRSVDFGFVNVAATVAALGLGSPKAQTIRNSDGMDFRSLIEAYRDAYGRKRVQPKGDEEARMAATIPDMRTRGWAEYMLAENRSLKRRLDLLKNAFTKIQPVSELVLSDGTSIDLSAAHARPSDRGGAAAARIAGGTPSFAADEVRAVAAFMRSVDDLDCDFDDATGALIARRSGLEVAPPGFRQALLRIGGDGGKE